MQENTELYGVNDFRSYKLYHHGILGQKWGIRRYQNADGSLTPAGKARLQKQDTKWAKKNYNKIYKETYKKSAREINTYVKTDLNKRMTARNKDGSLSKAYVNDYNRKLAELMNKNVSEIESPSGRVVQWIAKRGDVGVYMALADRGYNLDQVRNGVYDTGKIAYKKKNIDKV